MHQQLQLLLYNEVFCSFKDIKIQSKAFEIKQIRKDKRDEFHKQVNDTI